MPTTRPQSERSATYQTTDYHIGLVKSSYTGWSGLVYQTNISSYPTLCMAMRTWPKISIMIIALFQTESVASRIWLADSVTEGCDFWLVNIDLNLNGFLSLIFSDSGPLFKSISDHFHFAWLEGPFKIAWLILRWYDSYHMIHMIYSVP